ncbi:hypothetical protein Dimus_000780 [Dionaea muscipula]
MRPMSPTHPIFMWNLGLIFKSDNDRIEFGSDPIPDPFTSFHKSIHSYLSEKEKQNQFNPLSCANHTHYTTMLQQLHHCTASLSSTTISTPPAAVAASSSSFSRSHCYPKFSPSACFFRFSNITSPHPTSPPPRLILPPSSSANDLSSVLLQDPPNDADTSSTSRDDDQLLVVRRPAMDPGRVPESEEEDGSMSEGDTAREDRLAIDASLEEFAKKLSMFEPGRVESDPKRKPLLVNLDLALYRAKVLTKKYRYEEAEKTLQNCICYWPEDGRAYVALGKVLRKQSRLAEARAVYEKGCQATQGENAYIWQCWADLENKIGNTRKARELFDAATVADKSHIASWHGWAVLELKQGNVKKARSLLGNALKYCGGNEYIYQTLALLEAKANRYDQACYLFRKATESNPKSCASWLAWAQLEIEQENNRSARRLFERAVQASPKNRFAWHVWGLFEANRGNIDGARKLLKIGHLVNQKDPVLLQSLALLEYKHSTSTLARLFFRRASELDPSHQPVWFAWGWMEWKEGNIATARELYKKVLAIDSTTESAARCLQAWGVLEQRVGNLSAARRLFKSSLSVNSQSYVTWMTWASLEEDQGNSVRAEEIRNLYFQQRTEVVDNASWVMGFLDIIDPAVDRVKRFLNLDQNSIEDLPKKYSTEAEDDDNSKELISTDNSGFNLATFIKEKLSLDLSKLDDQMEASLMSNVRSRNQRFEKTVEIN